MTINVHETAGDFVDRNLYKLAIATHDYHSTHKRFAPINEYRDENGIPYLSWRVHLLPYLGYQKLFDQFVLTEPWDSENNLPLASQMPAVFGDGHGTDSNSTRIQSIVSPDGSFHDAYGQIGIVSNRESAFREIQATSHTLLYVQVGDDRAVPWTSPHEADFDFVDPLNTLGAVDSTGVRVVFMDGTTQILPATIDVDTFGTFASRWAGPLLGVDPATYFRQLASDDGGQTAVDVYDAGGNRQDRNLRNIGIGLSNFVSAYDNFPPNGNGVAPFDTSGLSWRVYLLPFLDEIELYKKFEIYEPWDSPTNLPLLDQMPDIFRSFGDSPDTNTTRIQKIVGPGAAWQRNSMGREISPRSRDFVDGDANTLTIVEAGPSKAVSWTKPDEFEFDPANPLTELGDVVDFFRAILADGSTIKLPADIDAETFSALVTRDSEETYSPDEPPLSEVIDAASLRQKFEDLNGIYDANDQSDRMKLVSLAHYDYESAYDSYPINRSNASYFNANGNAFLSWRVHILPFLGQIPLYEKFNLDEPWDSPNNLPLLQFMPDVYRDNDATFDSTLTRLQRFVDNGAMFSSDSATRIRDVLDGISNTILFVQTGTDVAVPWTKPQDIVFDPADPLAGVGDVEGGFFAAFADLNISYLQATDTELIKRLVTRNGGELLTDPTPLGVPIRTVVGEGQIGAIDVRLGPTEEYYEGPQSSPLSVVVADPSLVTVLTDEVVLELDIYSGYYSLTFQANDNGIVDGPRTTTISVGDQVFDVTVWDNDSFQMLVDNSEATVDESGATSIRNVVLNAQPDSDVVIAIDSLDTSEVSVSPATITFTPGNWDQPQSFVITGIDDGPLADQDTSTVVRLSVVTAGSDPQYVSAAPSADIRVTNLDNEDAQIVVAPDSLSVNEGESSSFLVSLAAEPTGIVLVDLVTTNPSQVGISTTQVSFASTDWANPKAVTLTAIDDVMLDGDASSQVTLTVHPSSNPAFLGADARVVSVVAVDDEVAGFTIVETGDTRVNESGTTDTFSVLLTAAPLTPVKIDVTPSNPGEAVVDLTQLVFDSSNWNQSQVVTVAGVDDLLLDREQASIITLSIAVGSEPGFAAVGDQFVNVTTSDDDIGQFQIDSTRTTALSEGGASATYADVVLLHPPLSNVVINVENGDETELQIGVPQFVFTPANWDTAQRIEFSSLDDLIVDGDQQTQVTFSVDATVSDSSFHNADSHVLTIQTNDNDAASFSVTETGGSTAVSETGSTDSVLVVLGAAPLSDVVLSLNIDDASEALVDKDELVFTPDNWSVPQTVTVTGADDSWADGEQIAELRLSVNVARSDAGFAISADVSKSVRVADDDVVGIEVIPLDQSQVSESGSIAEYLVSLTARPLTNVGLNLVGKDDSEAMLSPSAMVFTSETWDLPQTVTLTGLDDLIVDGDVTSHFTVSVDEQSDGAFRTLLPQNVAYTTTDDDTAALTVDPPSELIVNEAGATQTFWLRLAAAPLTDVVINATVDDATEFSISSPQVQFTPENWSTPVAVVVSGSDDLVDDGDQSGQLLFSIDPASDPAFLSLDDQSFAMTNVDNDQAGFDVQHSGNTLEVDELGSSRTTTVRLLASPLTDVVIAVSTSNASEVVTDAATLTFTSENWNQPQTVTMTGVNELVVDGDRLSQVTFQILTEQSDTAFHGLADQAINVTTVDNDTAALLINVSAGGLVVEEAGTEAMLQMRLQAAPLTDVVFQIESNDTTEASVGTPMVTFTPDNWDVLQTVAIHGVDDLSVDGQQTGLITISVDVEQSDSAFANLADQTASFTSVDDDVAGFTVADTDGSTVVSESGATDSVSIVLNAAPLSDVVLSIAGSDPSEVSFSSNAVTFTPADWNVPQTLTLTGVDDLMVDGDVSSNLTVSVTAASDAAFLPLESEQLDVVTTNDDVAQVVIVPPSTVTVDESGTEQLFEVSLSAAPLTDVWVSVYSTDFTELSTSRDSIQFTPSNWSTPVPVVASGVNDTLVDGNQVTDVVFSIDVSSDPAFVSLPNQTFDLTTVDLNQAG
ncbi:MAG: DUF1559 domain-containing protein, partial [Rubripirellula sp.]